MILTLRTDSPEVEIGLYEKSGEQLSYHKWLAERRLAKELLAVVHDHLGKSGADWKDIDGLIVFKGPGSFTGLRIGLTVANAVAYGNSCPIIGMEGDNWLKAGLARLQAGEDDKLILPHYGAEFKLTPAKK